MPYNPSSAYPRHSTYTPPVYGRGFARGFNQVDWGDPIRAGSVSIPVASISGAIQRAATPGTAEHARLAMEAMNRKGIYSALTERAMKYHVDKRGEMKRHGVTDDEAPRFISERVGGQQEIGAINANLDRFGNEYAAPPMDADEAAFIKNNAAGFGARPAGPIGSTGPVSPSATGYTPSYAEQGGANIWEPGMPLHGPGKPMAAGGREHVGGVNDRLGDIYQREQTTSGMNRIIENIVTGKAAGPLKIPNFFSGSPRRRGGK